MNHLIEKCSLNIRTVWLALLAVSLLVSCSEETFEPLKKETPPTVERNPTKISDFELCAGRTIHKPKVDLLFVFDNSGSSFFISPDVMNSLRNSLSLAARHFDIRAMFAPLFPFQNNSSSKYYLVSDSAVDVDGSKAVLVARSSIANIIQSDPEFLQNHASSSKERGFERAIEVLDHAKTHSLFRQESYLLTIFMSNGNDNGGVQGQFPDPADMAVYFQDRQNEFLALKNDFKSAQFRFISLVAHSASQGICRDAGFETGGEYKKMSAALYNAHNPSLGDQQGRGTFDSYDICTSDRKSLFDGPNKSIQLTTVGHTYNRWLISQTQQAKTPVIIKVMKNTGQRLFDIDINPSTSSGYRFLGWKSNLNTRIRPSVGEPHTGYMLELFGSGQVTYPECLKVETAQPLEHFGYLVLDTKPRVDSIEFSINKQKISQSSTNGWTYLGYLENKNIKIKSPSEPDLEGEPRVLKTGYFLKLHGSAIYDNNATVSPISYVPESLE